MSKHCDTCTCEAAEAAAERMWRRKREEAELEAKQREAEFARKHSILTDQDVRWTRERLANR